MSTDYGGSSQYHFADRTLVIESSANTLDSRLAKKLKEVKKDSWKLKFSGIGLKDVALKDIAEPVLGIIE